MQIARCSSLWQEIISGVRIPKQRPQEIPGKCPTWWTSTSTYKGYSLITDFRCKVEVVLKLLHCCWEFMMSFQRCYVLFTTITSFKILLLINWTCFQVSCVLSAEMIRFFILDVHMTFFFFKCSVTCAFGFVTFVQTELPTSASGWSCILSCP